MVLGEPRTTSNSFKHSVLSEHSEHSNFFKQVESVGFLKKLILTEKI